MKLKKMRLIRHIFVCFIFCKTMGAQNLVDTENELLSTLKEAGYCLEGEVLSSFMRDDHLFLSGNFVLKNCANNKIIRNYILFDNINFNLKDEALYISNYFKFNSSISSDNILHLNFRQTILKNGVVIFDTCFYNGPRLSHDELAKFHDVIKECKRNNKLLTTKIDEEGFLDTLFFGAIEGDKKCKFFFENLNKIIHKKKLMKNLGGVEYALHLRHLYIYNCINYRNITNIPECEIYRRMEEAIFQRRGQCIK